MGSDSDADDHESHSRRSRDCTIRQIQRHTLLLLVFIKDEDSRRLRHAVYFMHEIDGSEGEDSPPRVKHTRRVFPRPTYKASSACAVRCSGAANSCVYVRVRAIAVVDYVSRELLFKNLSANSGFMIRVVDPILPF